MFPDANIELTDEQIANLEDARKTIPKLKEQLRRAKMAGIDVSDQEEDLRVMEQQLEKLYRVYVRKLTTS